MDTQGTEFFHLRDFKIGETLGPAAVTLDDHRVRNFVYAVDDFNPWYIYDSPFGKAIAPVPLFTSDDPDFARLVTETVGEDTLASRFEISSFGPIRVGERYLLSAQNVDKYFRRSREYRTRVFEVRSATDDKLLLQSRLTEMVGAHPSGDVADTPGRGGGTLVSPSAAVGPVIRRAALGLSVDAPLPSLTKPIRRKQMVVFSARDDWWTNIHTDPDFAKSLGFPTAIAQALMCTGYISQMCTDFFGAAWIETGKASLSFLRPVCMGDELTIEGRVKGYETVEGEGERLVLNVWCANQNGELTAAGTAGAMIG